VQGILHPPTAAPFAGRGEGAFDPLDDRPQSLRYLSQRPFTVLPLHGDPCCDYGKLEVV
jgi:hypothetical protein